MHPDQVLARARVKARARARARVRVRVRPACTPTRYADQAVIALRMHP